MKIEDSVAQPEGPISSSGGPVEQQTGSAHSAGPWGVITDRTDTAGDGRLAIISTRSPFAFDVVSPARMPLAEHQANARLIAASPDLLASCRELLAMVSAAMRVIADLDAMKLAGADADTRKQRFVDECHVSGVTDGVGARAEAAIARAEGGQ